MKVLYRERPKIKASILLLLFSAMTVAFSVAPAAVAAQPLPITATPPYINLGQNTTIAITPPSPGTYTAIVTSPSGTSASLTIKTTTAGQTVNNIMGAVSTGFGQLVTSVGTYYIYLYQGTTLLATNTFTTTNQIFITTDMITAGYCLFVASGSRGQELLFQIHAVYASTGTPIALTAAQATAQGDVVTFTLPDGSSEAASVHAAESTAWPVPWYQAHVWGTWNTTSWVGNYAPVVTAKDKYGNTGTLNTAQNGYTFVYSPATLQETVNLNTLSGQVVSGLANNENVTITANVQYLVTPTAIEAVSGFNGPLTPGTGNGRGGVVTALVGWGFFNTTSNTFGSAKQPGGLIATVPLSYSTTTKVWTGTFNTGTLPALPSGVTSYTMIVNSNDRATPPNTGTLTMSVPPIASIASVAASATTATTTVTSMSTTTAVSTVTASASASPSTVTSTVSAPASTVTATSTAISTVSSVISSVSTLTTSTVSVAISTLIQTAQAVPSWAYVIMLLLLVIGGLFGYTMKRGK